MDTKIKFSDKANNLLKSNWAFVVFFSGMAIIVIMNLLLFGLSDNFSVDTLWWGSIYKTSSNAWIGWFEICFASVGSTLTIWGVILTIRFNKKFIYPLLIGETMVIIDAVMLGWTFTAFSYLLMIIFAIYNFIQWNKEETNESRMNKTYWILIALFVVLYISLGLLFINLTFNNLTIWSYNDVISSGLVAASWFVVLRKCKWGFLTFLLTDLFYIVAYTSVGIPATAFSYLIYFIIDSTSFISWWNTN